VDRDALMLAMRQTADAKPRAVKVPKWGTVYVRDVTVDEVEALAEETGDGDKKRNIARGCARVLCDETGKLLFDPANSDDLAFLGKQPWDLLRRIVKADEPGN
jgi:hypothetical protein